MKHFVQPLLFLLLTFPALAQTPKLVNIGEGWANNSVNTIIFRKNSLVSFKDTQYVAYYNNTQHVILGKRKIGSSSWILKQTPYKGNTKDAHNVISIMVDGEGYLHVAWDHHNNPLRYARSISPGSLELTQKMPMVAEDENSVSYPEFYKMPNGNLLFFYRNGASGQGNLVINSYDMTARKWERLHSNLISGEGERNAYWQAFLDHKGTIHVSWVWRESPNVASNHDLAYARSTDGGKTWEKSSGEKYLLPVTASSAEYALKIPQNSELINQTSMSADKKGNPFIASYWRESGSRIPQYHIVYLTGKGWKSEALNFRKTEFSLSGVGTKKIPISRPQIMIDNSKSKPRGFMIFRDEERGERVSAIKIENLRKGKWTISDLSNHPVGSWEPSYDTELWKSQGELHLFLQNVQQVDGEGNADIQPQMVQVLELKPDF